jgi:hypothetical protein
MQAPPVISGSLTLTGSITSTGPITGSGFFTAGTITAQTLVVQTITSSVSSITGSTKFGSIIGNTHQFTGSVLITGSAPALQISSSNYALSLVGGGATRYAGTISNTSGNLDFGIEGSAGNQLFTGAGPYEGGIGTSIARNFHLVSNSTVRMTISASGNVGIGTSSPTERLDVIGGAVAAGNGTIRTGITYSTLGLIGTFTNHNLGIITNGDTKMFISASGFVGIGTTSPTTVLHVSGSSSRVVLITTSGALSSGFYDAFQILAANQTGGGLSLNVGKAESNNDLAKMVYFHSSNGSTSNRLGFGFYGADGLVNILASGNVGIGTSSPSTKLHVSGPIGYGTSTYPQNIKLVKTGTTSVVFTITVPYTNNWNPAYATIRVAGSRTGLEEQYAAMYFIRLTYYGGSGISSVVNNVSGDTANASISISSNTANPQVWTITVNDGGASTDYLIADIDLSVNGGIISIA